MRLPSEYYQAATKQGAAKSDPTQQDLLRHFDSLYHQLTQHQTWWYKFINNNPIKGLYLYGGVGVGKTFLMDLFFDALPFKQKTRQHFHQFMHQIHVDLKNLAGTAEPLKIIAKNIAENTRVLCFDEFFVHDIADAMILGRLFQALFNYGVVCVMTSNTAPNNLYLNGLQRHRFLPTIKLLKQYLKITHINSSQDYRVLQTLKHGVFFTPHNAWAESELSEYFKLFEHEEYYTNEVLLIHGREIQTRQHAQDIVWFDFQELCSAPRSQADYLALGEEYPTLIISQVPQLTDKNILYFIHLIDILYDNHRRLILSTDVPLESLYTQGLHTTRYQRTLSRLHEMQSEAYLAQLS